MVNCINGTSGTGKTRKLLVYAKKENAIVICQNAAAMQRKALAYEILGLEIYDYNYAANLFMMGLGFGKKKIVVDEISDFVSILLQADCIGFSQTED